MSTSLLYHAFGIRGYHYTRTDYQDGATIFTIRQEPETCRCSACGSPRVQARGRVERRFRTVPIGRRAVTAAVAVAYDPLGTSAASEIGAAWLATEATAHPLAPG